MNNFIAFFGPFITLLGWSVYGLLMLVLVGVIISATIDSIVRRYYVAKLIYTAGLAEAAMKANAPQANGFAEMLQQVMKKAQETTKGGL